MDITTPVTKTGNQKIDGLLSSYKWAETDLTYSFPSKASYYSYGGEKNNKFEQFNSLQQSAVNNILDDFGDVSGLNFTKITETSTNHAVLRYAMSNDPSTAWAYYPSTGTWGGDAWFNNTSRQYDAPRVGNYAYFTAIHETGHAVGLKHGHQNEYGFPAVPAMFDSNEFTVMTYRGYIGQSPNQGYYNEKWGFAQSLMMLDIAALQHLYGANYDSRSGNTTYKWNPSTGAMYVDGRIASNPGINRIFMTVWDGGGIDKYDFSSYATDLKIDLRPGHWSTTSRSQLAMIGEDSNGRDYFARGNIANALLYKGNMQSIIENATGGHGDDKMIGNNADNRLVGVRGSDTLIGSGGQDKLDGRGGNDVMFGGIGEDTLLGGIGDDKLNSGASDDILLGGPGDDKLISGARNDILHGGPGDDNLIGGSHNDRLFGSDGRDTLFGGSGNDSLDGGRGNDKLTGWTGQDTLIGGSGNDTLFGGGDKDLLKGGVGQDILNGGIGADILWGGASADIFVISTGAGDDIIRDFKPGQDHIQLSGFGNIRKISDMQIVNNGDGDAVITIGNNTVTLDGISKGMLDNGDFLF